MSQSPLSEEDFQIGLGAFEGMLASQPGRTGSAAEAEVRKLVEKIKPGFGVAYDAHLASRRNVIETISFGNMVKNDGGHTAWYSGAPSTTGEWPSYEELLQERLPDVAVRDIDESTDRILSRCANPKEPGMRRKGIVIGYVQSGKTANYAGLIAKAVDVGYRIVIVLAGMHTNLRAQTQLRLMTDLKLNDATDKRGGLAWSLLTGKDTDIGDKPSVGFMRNTNNVAIMVVKKHEKRLANVAKFLREIPDDTLRNRAVLILDDESDQATPNTLADREFVSTINQRVRDIWKEVPTGTYVAYTATPFANIFIDPSDEDDMYPEDFAMVLPKPTGYMGADSFFNVTQTADSDEDQAIDALSQVVPKHEAECLVPKARAIESFEPEITPSLDDAIRWFILATAIRQLRTGKAAHSSMLLHTSHLVRAHEALKDVVARFTSDIALNRLNEEDAFRTVFEQEIDRASSLRGGATVPSWTELWERVNEIIGRLTVKIDNGQSHDRLSYPDESPQFVIAIGGGTLSRGLTLEGLVVSYFLRSSNAYDTLLQMGRWFGFRPQYQDLVRVWVGPGLLEDYAHLASVEREIRAEVADLEIQGKTPRELAIRVRSHPGRLQITSPGKMSNTMVVHAGLGGTRRQTVYLDRSVAGAQQAQRAARSLVERNLQQEVVSADSYVKRRNRPSRLFTNVSNEDLVQFLKEYWVASADPWLQPDAMQTWIDQHGHGVQWNLVLVSGPSSDSFEFAPGTAVGLVSRAPLEEKYWSPTNLPEAPPEGSDIVNIRALMSGADSLTDLKLFAKAGQLDDPTGLLDSADTNQLTSVRAVRRLLAPKTGVILLYPVNKDSHPLSKSKTRRDMASEEHLIGLGILYPHAENEVQGEYLAAAVRPPLSDDDISEGQPEDSEGDHVGGAE